MRRPWYYATFTFIGAVIAAFKWYGDALDVLSNAAQWITLPVTVWGSGVVSLLFVVQALIVKVFKPRWVVNGQTVIAKQLNRQHWAAAAGLLLLLWVPRFLSPAGESMRAAISMEPEEYLIYVGTDVGPVEVMLDGRLAARLGVGGETSIATAVGHHQLVATDRDGRRYSGSIVVRRGQRSYPWVIGEMNVFR